MPLSTHTHTQRESVCMCVCLDASVTDPPSLAGSANSSLIRPSGRTIRSSSGRRRRTTPPQTLWTSSTMWARRCVPYSVCFFWTRIATCVADVHSQITATIHTRTMNIIADLEHPNVTTYCLYGYNVSTPIAYTYADFTGNSNDVGDPIATDTSGTLPLLTFLFVHMCAPR